MRPIPATAEPPPDLAALLRATASGDRQAFRTLYDATSSRLFGMALAVLRRRDAAEDALQEAYLRIWSHATSYDPARGAAMAWMMRTTRNAAIDRLRIRPVGDDDIDDHGELLDALAANLDERLDIARALATLSAEQRQAVLLIHLHGFTAEEIAARLDAPVGTVKSWIRRGAARLVRHYEAAERPVEPVPELSH